MKKLTIYIFIIFSSRIYAQTICEGQQVVPIETFNQCNTNPYVLVFEDSFDGNSLDLSRWTYGPRIRYCNNEQQYYTSGDDVVVTDIEGKLIESFKELKSSAITIDLNGNTKGVYVLYLLNNQDKNITTHKIIHQ